MTCLKIDNAIVCGDFGAGEVEVTMIHCPTCKKRRRFLRSHGSSSWYEPIDTCLTCGDKWEGEERLPRPFCRGWRAESVAKAKARLKR